MINVNYVDKKLQEKSRELFILQDKKEGAMPNGIKGRKTSNITGSTKEQITSFPDDTVA